MQDPHELHIAALIRGCSTVSDIEREAPELLAAATADPATVRDVALAALDELEPAEYVLRVEAWERGVILLLLVAVADAHLAGLDAHCVLACGVRALNPLGQEVAHGRFVEAAERWTHAAP